MASVEPRTSPIARYADKFERIDEERALASAERLAPEIQELAREVRAWIFENA